MTVPGAFAQRDNGRFFRGQGRKVPRRSQGSSRLVQETAGFPVDLQKPPDLLLQLNIPAASFADVAVPLLRR
jgi:hypothetical protein